jgi:hypothetical protein
MCGATTEGLDVDSTEFTCAIDRVDDTTANHAGESLAI